jgi:hypothetical protein
MAMKKPIIAIQNNNNIGWLARMNRIIKISKRFAAFMIMEENNLVINIVLYTILFH